MNVELKEHHNFYCDLCLQNPIQNARYHCIICKDFDVCSTCHSKGDHRNPFKLPDRIKLKHDVFSHPLMEIWSTRQAAWLAVQEKMNSNPFAAPSQASPPSYSQQQQQPPQSPSYSPLIDRTVSPPRPFTEFVFGSNAAIPFGGTVPSSPVSSSSVFQDVAQPARIKPNEARAVAF